MRMVDGYDTGGESSYFDLYISEIVFDQIISSENILAGNFNNISLIFFLDLICIYEPLSGALCMFEVLC